MEDQKDFSIWDQKKLKDAIKAVLELAEGVIRPKRSNKASLHHEDILSRFMGMIKDNVFLRDNVISFLLAGRDSVASTLTSFFLLLSKNPETVQKILEESKLVMGSREEAGKLVSLSQLREMHYLQAAVHEAMRLFPPVQFDSKFCENDDGLPGGTFVGRGTRVTYHPYAMERMERIWGEDYHEFKPERWLEDGVFKMEDPFKYSVFQAGSRVCLGKEMALVEMKTVALSLIRRFDIQVATDRGWALKFVPGLNARIRGGLLVIVRRR